MRHNVTIVEVYTRYTRLKFYIQLSLRQFAVRDIFIIFYFILFYSYILLSKFDYSKKRLGVKLALFPLI